mgnify:CR=1 FL=1
MQPKCYLRMGSEVYVIQCYDNPSVNLGMALSYLAHRMKQRKCKICLENWQERCERCERDCYGHEQGKMALTMTLSIKHVECCIYMSTCDQTFSFVL